METIPFSYANYKAYAYVTSGFTHLILMLTFMLMSQCKPGFAGTFILSCLTHCICQVLTINSDETR